MSVCNVSDQPSEYSVLFVYMYTSYPDIVSTIPPIVINTLLEWVVTVHNDVSVLGQSLNLLSSILTDMSR